MLHFDRVTLERFIEIMEELGEEITRRDMVFYFRVSHCLCMMTSCALYRTYVPFCECSYSIHSRGVLMMTVR